MRTFACQVCGKPIEYAGTGRRPRNCASRCKKRAERARAREREKRRQSLGVEEPRERVLTRAERAALLGREPYSGDWAGYLEATGRSLGGFPR